MVMLIVVALVAFGLGIVLGLWLRSEGAKAIEQEVEVHIGDLRADVVAELVTAENAGKVGVGTVWRYVEAHLHKAPAASAAPVLVAAEPAAPVAVQDTSAADKAAEKTQDPPTTI